MFDAFDHGLSTVPYANKEKPQTLSKIITLISITGANEYEEKNHNSISQPPKRYKILKAQIGVIRKFEVISPCSQMFFSIAGEVKIISCNFGNKFYFYLTHCGFLRIAKLSQKKFVNFKSMYRQINP